jgi:hypothetical protein
MPLILIPTTNDTCFYCGKQAFFVSVNTKTKRCTEKVNQCPGVISKMKQSRTSNGFDIKAHMKNMSIRGNEKLKELHTDEDWVKNKGNKISAKVKERGGHSGINNPMYNKKHKNSTIQKLALAANNRNPQCYIQATNTKILNGNAVSKELKSDWELYEEQVDNITRISWIKHKNLINPYKLPRGKQYELDHKFSKYEGFINKVPPEIIGHYANLEVVPKQLNRSKSSNSSISLTELYERINS